MVKNGNFKYVYLLDIYLELGLIGQYSQSIVELVINEAIEKSYRKTAESIRENTNVSITHTAAREILIKFSKEHIEKVEKEKLKLYEKGYIEGNKSVSIIFQEDDGIYISMQDRKKNKEKREGKKKKKEIKIGIVHEGFEKRYSKDFRIKNKQMIATTKDAKHFKRLVDMTIGTTYNESDIQKIIINADGADWCKSIVESPKERYQLDMFHIQKRISETVKDEEYKKMMSDIVKTNKPEEIFHIIYNYKVELESDNKQDELEKVKSLEEYLNNNRKGLLRYQYDLGLTQEEISDKTRLGYRNLGTEESQMYCGCKKRMKKNRTSWSPYGALSERELEPKKIPKIKLGKVKYAGKQTILESLEKYNRPIIEDILREKSFNEMNVMC